MEVTHPDTGVCRRVTSKQLGEETQVMEDKCDEDKEVKRQGGFG